MPDSKTLAFLAGLVCSAFGAGITFSVWEGTHPTKKEIAEALGCVAYNSTLEGCVAAKDAVSARKEVMALQADLRALRYDLSRGFGRSLSVTVQQRDAAAKRAMQQFQNDIARGLSPEEALRNVLESDFP